MTWWCRSPCPQVTSYQSHSNSQVSTLTENCALRSVNGQISSHGIWKKSLVSSYSLLESYVSTLDASQNTWFKSRATWCGSEIWTKSLDAGRKTLSAGADSVDEVPSHLIRAKSKCSVSSPKVRSPCTWCKSQMSNACPVHGSKVSKVHVSSLEF